MSLFLFQEALASHWTVCVGTLIALLSPKVLPDKGGKAQRLALSVDTPWQVRFMYLKAVQVCVYHTVVQT